MAVKYKQYLKEMYDANKELFDSFETVHAEYGMNKAKHQNEYNSQGASIMRIVEEWESKLCNRMEKGKNSSYSHRLADKFREELRVRFPLIDFVGVKIKTAPEFSIPQIKFS